MYKKNLYQQGSTKISVKIINISPTIFGTIPLYHPDSSSSLYIVQSDPRILLYFDWLPTNWAIIWRLTIRQGYKRRFEAKFIANLGLVSKIYLCKSAKIGLRFWINLFVPFTASFKVPCPFIYNCLLLFIIAHVNPLYRHEIPSVF